MMTVALVTGSNGFCARHLLHRLEQEEHLTVIGADLDTIGPHEVGLDGYYPVDIRRWGDLETLVKRIKPDWIFHLAGSSASAASELLEVNLVGTVHLLEAVAIHAPRCQVLLVGSAAEYGNIPTERLPVNEDELCRPMGPYGLSKNLMSTAGLYYANRKGLKIVIVRPFNLVGAGIPGNLVVGALLDRIRHVLISDTGGVIQIGNLESARDFLAVEDAVDSYVRAIRSNHWGEIFNLCSGQPRTIRSVVEKMLHFSPRALQLQVDPRLFRVDEIMISYGNPLKAAKVFGHQVKIPLEVSLRAAWDHVMQGVDL